MNRYDRLIALCGTFLGLVAMICACIAFSLGNWEKESKSDYFRSVSKYHQLYLSRIMSTFSLIFTVLGICASALMLIKKLWKYWNLFASSAYLLATFTILLAMSEASRLMHHNGWPSYIYATTFILLLLDTQLMSVLAGKLIFST
ncbi:unnamed protein product [Adineta ricciae]|uniref:Uncharacterized protein n=1 Tax=Adineta ricciae TaxID=249248 RepID=A0A814LZG8_ADIRI|nr:unnamed protein product [Adineta ricciae]CAF1072354.1 unnamed protein product [Adineta ricciae]